MGDSELFKAAFSKEMALCSKREYCREDIRLKLNDWGLGDNDSGRVLATLVSEKFIDEKRYSRAFARDKFNYNKWGKIKISALLRMKRIPSETISEALASIDQDLYLQTLKDLISSHRKHVRAKNQFEMNGKLLRFALSKGFESSLVYDILKMEE